MILLFVTGVHVCSPVLTQACIIFHYLFITTGTQKRKRPEKPAVQVDDSEIKGND